jgi:hypothetical protein
MIGTDIGGGLTDERRATRWHRWWPFLLLVAAGASHWLLVAARPETGSTLGSEALGCLWAALVAWSLPGREAKADETGYASRWKTVLAGAMLLGGPMCAILVRGRRLDAGGITMALALTPVVIAIASAAMSEGSSDGISGRMWPGLAAVTGLLLVLESPGLGDVRSDVALVLTPVLTGVGAAMFCAGGAVRRKSWALALAGGAALFALGAAEAKGMEHLTLSATLPAVACDGLLALLAVVALGRLGAVRWSAQFTLLPLLIILEGIVLVRPALSTRWVVGMLLLAVASVFLLMPPEPDEGTVGQILTR